MDISDQIQMLMSAFTFGLLFQSTSAALLLYINGHGSTIFRDHRRLVLVLFLTSAALWAQIDFINFAVPSTSPKACQATIIASTFFDQSARVTIGGFLLWSVGHAKKTPVESSGLCALMGIRIVMGFIFVAYARPQFAPVCVARSDLLAASVTVMVLDMIIIGVLTIRVFTLGLWNEIREVRPSTKQEQSKALVYCTASLFLWTLTSSAMVVGMPPIALLLRTGLPAIGLMILVLILTIYNGALILPRADDSITPEARSPFVAPLTHTSSSLSDDDGSPVREAGYTRTAKLFVVNPSNTPHDSSVMTYLEDVKAEDDNYTGYRSTGIRAVATNTADSFIAGDVVNNRASSGIFRSLSAATLDAIGSAAFLAAPRQAPVPSSARLDQTRALTTPADISSTETHQKRPRFGWSKKSADKGVDKIVISNPVMDAAESLSAQPFARMRTIDLATAVMSERQRREGANNRELVAKRPAPPPPTASEASRNSSSTRRKEIPRGTSAPLTLKLSGKVPNESRLSVTVDASSTSASLSPGREDVRRRSPRSMKALEDDIEKACFQASRPNTIVVSKRLSDQTVMYVNDIVYDHPGMVKSIIKEAPIALKMSKSERYGKLINSPTSSAIQPDSILHRPRPYRRDSEKERVFFASEPSPRHKRSKSSPSTVTKKTNLHSNSSITDVPALPQRPTTAAGLKKLLPGDTCCMTVDEKISLLFPAPPEVHRVHSRRSSVPSLPRIPSIVLVGDSFTKMLTDQELQEHRTSKRTTISFGSQIENDGLTPMIETPIINERGIYRFSANTYRTLAESPRDPRIPELPIDVQSIVQAESDGIESQVSNSQRHSTITSSSSEVDGSHDDSKSAWASIHSPVPAIDLITAQRTARETYIRMRKDARAKSNEDSPKIFRVLSQTEEDEGNVIGDGEGLMTVIFGAGEIAPPPTNMRSFLLNPSPIMPESNVFLSTGHDVWHKRIGDELLAFSQRRKCLRSRTMPPPTPLLLGSNRRQTQVAVRDTFIDEEEDSPETALKEIQAQLSKFEGITGESLGSLMRSRPEDSSKLLTVVGDDRMGLIASLELEMGQQETLWMRMQHNFDRDSNSAIITPQIAECTPRALLSPPSEKSFNRTPRSVNRRPRIRNRCDELTSVNLAHSPSVSKSNMWQQRLAEAEMKFKGNAQATLGAANINFLSISKIQLGSPTPPDSLGSESDPETEMDYDTDEVGFDWGVMEPAPSREMNSKALWQPKPLAPGIRVGNMWHPTHDISMLRTASPEPAAKGLRSIKRRDLHTLSIKSSNLWTKPVVPANRPPIGLWGSRMTRPRTIIARPRAERPQRKSKRVTFLPDILENPSPLPQKRDTLGIFRFPWGEKSDSALYNPFLVPNRASQCSFVSNSSLEPNQTQPDPEPAEYSSSFFDDYEEDYERESEMNSDDDFDESTLWEIATLLNSQDVPSRNSLFPCPRIIEDYDDEDDSETDVTEGIRQLNQSTSALKCPEMVKFVPIWRLKPLPPLPTPQESDDYEQAYALEGNDLEAAAPTWQVYIPDLDNAVRGEPYEAVSQDSGPRPKANSRILWDKAIGAVSSLPVEKALTLWTRQSGGRAERMSLMARHEKSEENSKATLWTAREPYEAPKLVGLCTTSMHCEDNLTPFPVPAALATFRKPRVPTTLLPTILSQQLWSPSMKSAPSEFHWISVSSVPVLGSSLYSASSSGRPSPSLDKGSVASTITNALSLADLDQESLLNLDKEIKRRKVIASSIDVSPAVDERKPAVGEQPLARPASWRGSRVMASRDLWESRAPSTDSTLNRTNWRVSRVNMPDACQEKQQKVVTTTKAVENDVKLTEATRAATGYDSATRHPVFFAIEMVSNAAIVHPAATGYVAQPLTDAEEVQKKSLLWGLSSSVTSRAPESALLWNEPKPAEKSLYNITEPPKGSPAKKRTKDLPLLIVPIESSTTLWNPKTSTGSSQQHWLHATAPCTVPTSILPIEQSPLSMLFANTFLEQSPVSARTETVVEASTPASSGRNLVWTAPMRSNRASQTTSRLNDGLWVPVEHEDRQHQKPAVQGARSKSPFPYKRSPRPIDLGKIESTELWRPLRRLSKRPEDWLTSRRATKVDFRY